VVLVYLQQRHILATDTLLGIMAHAALAVGMVAVSFLDQVSFDLHSYLFGDILTVRAGDLYWILGGGLLVLALLVLNWPALVLTTIHSDLARAEGVPVLRTQILLMFLMTVVVAVSIRIVGILLITSMLIIPAATARQLVHSPEAMALTASVLGMVAVVLGILGSVLYDTPSGPSIVAVAALMFAVVLAVSILVQRHRRSPRAAPPLADARPHGQSSSSLQAAGPES